MGKQGPCCHCGITSTPLWRNGPPEKPVLCNACGSRWRTKGTLENYTPLHARYFQPLDTEESDYTQECDVPSKTTMKNIDIKANDAAEIKRRDNFVAYDLCPPGLEDDTSNRSSSESAISCSESCVQLGSTEGNEISGSVQFNFWDPYIPSKKRSRTRHHSPSPVEKLRQNLVDILQEQEPSSLSTFSEEVLIFEKEDSRFSAEIGLGGVLLKPSVFFTREESEASSLVIENYPSCLNNGCVESLLLQSQSSEFSKSQESYRLIKETGDTEDLKVHVAKPSALRNQYLGNTLLKNPDIVQNTPSPQMQISWESQNESFTPSKEMPETTSCSSCLVGGGNSLPLKRNLDLPYLPASEGPSFDTIEGFKIPKEQMVLQKTLSSTSMSAFSIDRISSILPLTEFRAKTSDGDIQMQAHPGNNVPFVKLPSPLALQKAETDSAPETNQYPNNRNIN